MNFCFTQYNELNKELQTLKQLNYTHIFSAAFSIPEDNSYEQLRSALANELKNSAILLNYQRNPLYTTIKNNRIVPIRVITAEEAEYFHIFNQTNPSENVYFESPPPNRRHQFRYAKCAQQTFICDDAAACGRTKVYSVIVSDNLKNQFKPGTEYSLPIGMHVHEDTWKIKVMVIDCAGSQLLMSSDYRGLSKIQDTLLIYDPNNTLPLHISPSRKPVFYLYLYVIDIEKTIAVLKNYPLVQIKKMQDNLEHSANFKAQILPSYFKFLCLGVFIYLVLSINLYILFYYKKKKDILIFNYCNFNHTFYFQCLGILTLLQLCFGFIPGQILWFCYCRFSQTTYWHNERIFIPILALIHLCIFLVLNRGYKYLVQADY